MEMAVPSNIAVEFDTTNEAVEWFKNGFNDEKRTIVLFSNLSAAKRAFDMGFAFDTLNLGNIHFCEGKVQVSCNLCLDKNDSDCIIELTEKGVSIDSRSVPVEKKIDFSKLLDAVENKSKIKEAKKG
jgi:PTS system mannose-specific IIB component